MKKILQRIGLLAAAVLLLWGWQGMNAKADDYTGNWTVDRTGLKNCHIMLSTMIDSKMYDCFSGRKHNLPCRTPCGGIYNRITYKGIYLR